MTKPRTRLLAAAVACAAIGFSAVGASPAAAKTCGGLGDYPVQGGYYTKLTVSGTSCSGGKDVMRGHTKCRLKHGRKGKCPSFNGWSCSETRRFAPGEFSSRVTCRKSGRTVVYYYSTPT